MKGFASYAHADHRLVREFRPHLAAVERAFGLKIWFDDQIKAGRHWRGEIGTAIDSADMILLLCTPNFIFSEYIWKTELPAIRRRQKRGALVITVILEASSWEMVTGDLQAVPTENGMAKPVTDWQPRKKGMDRAQKQITDAIQLHFGVSPKAIKWWRL